MDALIAATIIYLTIMRWQCEALYFQFFEVQNGNVLYENTTDDKSNRYCLNGIVFSPSTLFHRYFYTLIHKTDCYNPQINVYKWSVTDSIHNNTVTNSIPWI